MSQLSEEEREELLESLEKRILELMDIYQEKGLEFYQISVPMMTPVISRLIYSLPDMCCAMVVINHIVNGGIERYQGIMKHIEEQE